MTFTNNGTLTPGIIHVAGTSPITLVNPGSYTVTFTTISSNSGNYRSFAIYINGLPYPGGGIAVNVGSIPLLINTVIVTTTAANSILTIRNRTGIPAQFFLDANGAVNASVAIALLNI